MPDEIIETMTEPSTEPMTETPRRYKCRHIFIAGARCGSPSLRGAQFCYYHHTTRGFADEKRYRRSWKEFELPPLEDRSSVLAAITEVLQRIACGSLPSKQAGLLLYGLQIASLNLPKTGEAKPDEQDDQPVEEVITNPRFGDLAPVAEIDEAVKPSILPTLQANAASTQHPCPTQNLRFLDRRRDTCRRSAETPGSRPFLRFKPRHKPTQSPQTSGRNPPSGNKKPRDRGAFAKATAVLYGLMIWFG